MIKDNFFDMKAKTEINEVLIHDLGPQRTFPIEPPFVVPETGRYLVRVDTETRHVTFHRTV